MFCICENKDADQLRGDCEADQHLCFRYIDSTIPLLSKSEISSLWPSSVTVQPGLCRTWSKPERWFSHEAAQLFFIPPGIRIIPPVYEVYTGYIVFAFSVRCLFVCLSVNFFSVKDFSETT